MSDDASWIDDVIKQHKKQLDDLKNKKNSIDDNLTYLKYQNDNKQNLIGKISKTFKDNEIDKTKKYQTINLFDKEKFSSNKKSNNLKNISVSQEINSLNYNKKNNNEEEDELIDQIIKLKEDNKSLKMENENLKNKNDNNINNDIEKYKKIIEQLNNQLNKMEEDKDNNEKKIKQLENIKSKEIELMNQKIKNFEIIIEENSENYINEIKMLKLQIQNNKLKLDENNKYIEIVNSFINRIDNIMGIQSKQIIDIQELQNKFIEIENIIQNLLNNQNININNNINNNIINNNLKEEKDNNINKEEEINNENYNEEKEENNESHEELKVPHFQNKILEQGLCNHQINSFPLNNNEDKFQIFRNLEQRIIDLEKKLYESPNQENQNYKIKKNHQNNHLSNQFQKLNIENKSTSKNKVLRSKSSNKINNDNLFTQYKNSNINQININQPKKGKKIKKTQRKKILRNHNETSSYILNNNNNDNYSVSNFSTLSNLKNNLQNK